jgi:hypothetical protein
LHRKAVKTWRVVRRLLVTAIVGLLIGGGIWLLSGDDDSSSNSDQGTQTKTDGSTSDDPEPADPAGPEDTEPEAALPPTVCPPDVPGCVSATGRVLYVEKVDPDGDGDAHFVTASKESVTGPGITIFDVRTDLRPDPLPGIGDLVGGAGPVYPGHAGQKQIEVVVFAAAE